ncbi:c-Myc-binding protein-like protein, partial [Drosera capensis]
MTMVRISGCDTAGGEIAGSSIQVVVAILLTPQEKEAKKEAFRKYLESNGVMDALTKVLVALYEQNDKPSSAVEFIQQKLGGPTLQEYKKLQSEMTTLQMKYDELLATHKETCRQKKKEMSIERIWRRSKASMPWKLQRRLCKGRPPMKTNEAADGKPVKLAVSFATLRFGTKDGLFSPSNASNLYTSVWYLDMFFGSRCSVYPVVLRICGAEQVMKLLGVSPDKETGVKLKADNAALLGSLLGLYDYIGLVLALQRHRIGIGLAAPRKTKPVPKADRMETKLQAMSKTDTVKREADDAEVPFQLQKFINEDNANDMQ